MDIAREIAKARDEYVQEKRAERQEYRRKLLARLTDLLGEDAVNELNPTFPEGSSVALITVPSSGILRKNRPLQVELEHPTGIGIRRPGDWRSEPVWTPREFWLTVDALR